MRDLPVAGSCGTDSTIQAAKGGDGGGAGSGRGTTGYLTGLAVVALTVYVATIARRREYGVLKAVGIRNRRLYEVVLIQALISVTLGLLAALGITLLLSAVIPRVDGLMVLTVSPASVLRVAAVSAILAALAALLPARQLAGLEPVTAMRKG